MTARQTKPKTVTNEGTAMNNAYAPHPELMTAITALAAALDTRQQVDAAMGRHAVTLAAAEADHTRLAGDAEQLAVEVALDPDPMRNEDLDSRAEFARTMADDAERAAIRMARLGAALHSKARDADAVIATARAALDVERQIFFGNALAALDVQMVGAAQALKPLVAAVVAFQQLQAISYASPLLRELRIPSPAHDAPPVLDGTQIRSADGATLDLLTTWQDHVDPALAELADGALAQVTRRAASHRPFAPPAARAPYTPNEQNLRAAELNRAAEAREAAHLAANPAPAWHGQSWRL